MAMTIHKHPLFLGDSFTLALPEGAEFLSAQIQQGKAQAWFRVDDSKPLVRHVFGFCGTGQPLPEYQSKAKFLATLQFDGGTLVLHLFGGEQV